uniref:Tyrosine-protein kinase n=1 Tax=Arion vulgaris TaxID=1028688 RepID=A0A0B6ZX32_9EUPU
MTDKAGSNNISLDNILTSGSISVALQKDKDRCDDADLNKMWYHGKMSRSNAEKILNEAMRRNPDKDCDGIFLVRDSTASEVNFSLSFIFEQLNYHFYIQRTKECYYCIDGGPVVHGLDMLIEHYIEVADRLPTRLTNICKGYLPPPKVRKYGPTNLLHKAVKAGKTELVKQILNHPLCPDVNAKNSKGSTALHDAAEFGLDEIVSLLLSHNAEVNMKDTDGDTPIWKACVANKITTIVLLLTNDISCVQDRNPVTGCSPLHAAAMHGHKECVQMLLNAGAAVYSRGANDETPIELAERFRRPDCILHLENYKEQPVSTSRSDWFHPELDRQGAENILKNHQPRNGLFLIRPNKYSKPVLSLFKDMGVYHYEIKKKEYRNQHVFFIDDGPFHRSLELLVQYYSTFEDGLGMPLQASVSTRNEVVELNIPVTYSNLTSPKSPVPTNKHKPKLPPRPPDVESPPNLEALPVPEALSAPQFKTENSEPLKKIALKNLKLGKELGQGEYGCVLKGILTIDKKLLRKERVNVAIKTFHSIGNLTDFTQEAYVMQSLKHDYIVELLGICDGPPLMLVEEFVSMGSMLDYLEDHAKNVRVKKELYLWASQIAEGMMYLETKRLVHRDLAARNILLCSLERVKISDFGLSRAMGTDKEYYKASKGGRWPIKWYAPESVNFGLFTHASDVWSYGVTLWEMFSYGGAPYEDMTGVEVIKFIEDGKRLEKPEKCPDVVYNVMLKCWSYDKGDRVTFTDLNRHFNEEPEYTSARELKKTVKNM